MNHKSHSKPGFSFMEVLVALALFGVISVALVKISSSLLFKSRRAYQYAEAVMHAQNMRAQAELNHWGDSEKKTKKDQFGPYDVTYKNKKISFVGTFFGAPEKKSQQKINLVRETVTVEWPFAGSTEKLNLISFVYVPEKTEKKSSEKSAENKQTSAAGVPLQQPSGTPGAGKPGARKLGGQKP